MPVNFKKQRFSRRAMTNHVIHRAEIVHFLPTGAAADGADADLRGARGGGMFRIGGKEAVCEYFPDGALMVRGGRVVKVGDAEEMLRADGGAHVVEHRDALLMPGFVDSHVHFPQTDIIAAPGESLLEWLQKYTFPAEMRYQSPEHCAAMAEFFLDMLLSSGVTTALVFASVHRCSADALFAAARRRNMRLLAGKVMMDRNAPAALCDTAQSSFDDSLALAEKWHDNGRLRYAVTPRFAPTSSAEQLAAAGRLMEEIPGALLHTHLSENRAEIAWVRELFPDTPDYLGVYERFGLSSARSVFAHCLHLCDDEWRRLSSAGAAIACCPTSNLFLGSGLFSQRTARAHGLRVGYGSDVGGGTSFSPLRVMDEAYKTARLRGEVVGPFEMWKTATLGGAEALGVADSIGNFAAGKEADFIILDLRAPPLLRRRLSQCTTLSEKLFALAVLGGEEAVRAAYIAGEDILPRRT
ncbi:MAG: guanine deaminase [Gammaproteobacteria bacterium]